MNSWYWFFGALSLMTFSIMEVSDGESYLAIIWMIGSVIYGAIWAQELSGG